jgi:hypothetical protein
MRRRGGRDRTHVPKITSLAAREFLYLSAISRPCNARPFNSESCCSSSANSLFACPVKCESNLAHRASVYRTTPARRATNSTGRPLTPRNSIFAFLAHCEPRSERSNEKQGWRMAATPARCVVVPRSTREVPPNTALRVNHSVKAIRFC